MFATILLAATTTAAYPAVPDEYMLLAAPVFEEALYAHGFGTATFDELRTEGNAITISNLRTANGERSISASSVRISAMTEEDSVPAWLWFGQVELDDFVFEEKGFRVRSDRLEIDGMRTMNDFDNLSDTSEYEYIDGPFAAVAFDGIRGDIGVEYDGAPIADLSSLSLRTTDWIGLGGLPTRIEADGSGTFGDLVPGFEPGEAFAIALRLSGVDGRSAATLSTSLRTLDGNLTFRLHAHGLTSARISEAWEAGSVPADVTFSGLVAEASGLSGRTEATSAALDAILPLLSGDFGGALRETVRLVTADGRRGVEMGMGSRVPFTDVAAGGTIEEAVAARLKPRSTRGD